MPSTTEQVRKCIEGDVFLQVTLGRGIGNLRAVARWMQRHHGVQGSLDAIVSALRRFETGADDPIKGGLQVLRDSNINVRGGVCAIVLSVEGQVSAAIAGLHDLPGVGDDSPVLVFRTSRRVTVVLDQEVVPAALEWIGDDLIQHVHENLVELSIPNAEAATRTPGVLSLATTALAARGVNVVVSATNGPDLHVFVPANEHVKAYNALSQLTGDHH